jgi:hypothetical protein
MHTGFLRFLSCGLPFICVRRAPIVSLLLACALLGLPIGAEAQGFDPARVGGPSSGAPAELYLPAATPPPGAIVILHGCDGVGPHYRQWARRLTEWGYAALLIDSFGPRGFHTKSNFNQEFQRVTGKSPSAWRTERSAAPDATITQR